MLLRAYRLTDKLGLILIKLLVALTDQTLAGLLILRRALTGLLSLLLRPFALVGGLLLRGATRAGGSAVRAGATSAQTSMARRAARREIDKTLVEDPLKRQNRLLSGFTVLVLLALVAVVLWATQPAPSTALPVVNLGASGLLAGETAQPTPNPIAALPSPVPTATALPGPLQARGTLAYSARVNGQSDLFALPIGSRAAVRLTDHPADDRDPSWSPDGQRLAFASRRDGNWELYIQDFAADTLTRMTFDLAFQAGPSWSPDGRWLVYESYSGGSLDIWYVRVDGSEPAAALPGMSDAPEFAPAWSPDGRRVAFVSWRDGNQDIYVLNFDDVSVTNVTNTPLRDEDHPAWSPDGDLLAFSAFDEGIEKVFVQPVDGSRPPQVVAGGRSPAWSPDGASIAYTVDSAASAASQLIAAPYTDLGIITTIADVPFGATNATWSSVPLPQPVIAAGVIPLQEPPLFIEQQEARAVDPPYQLRPLNGVDAPLAALSERVNDSFNALRERAVENIGWDFLGTLQDAFWDLNRLPEPGEERRNWLMTGRAFAFNRNAIVGFPAPVEIIRQDIGVETRWRVFVRVADEAQVGQLGEPLRALPWDFLARDQRDVQAYDEGGRRRAAVPGGYYVDFTQLAADYGWQRVAAGSDWRANLNSVNYWLFIKPDGLDWYTAMREIYGEGALINFAPTAIPTQPGLTAPTLTAAPTSAPLQATNLPLSVPTIGPAVPTIGPAAGSDGSGG